MTFAIDFGLGHSHTYKVQKGETVLSRSARVTLAFDTALSIVLITVGILMALSVIPCVGSAAPFLAGGSILLGVAIPIIDGLALRKAKKV